MMVLRFSNWQRADFQAAIDANLTAPVFMIQGLIEGMKARGFGRLSISPPPWLKLPARLWGSRPQRDLVSPRSVKAFQQRLRLST